MSEDKKVALALGSNMGDRHGLLAFALDELAAAGLRDIKCGRMIVSEPVDCPDGSGEYLNSALVGYWNESAEDLLSLCLKIEAKAGRRRTSVINEARLLDIDVLLYDEEIYTSDHLQVPHPRMHLRDFVLIALNDVAADWRHPVLGQTVQQLLGDLN